jgi:phosphatidylcholine synthase
LTQAGGRRFVALTRKLLEARAWAVHGYTALGAVLGLLSLHYSATGAFRASFLAMGIAMAIDSSDGALARAFEVRERLPGFNGDLLDNIVDYLTYVAAPVFLMLRAKIIVPNFGGWVLASCVIIASAYGFCRAEAKTRDHYFLGFPSYWNLVAFYLFGLDLPPWLNAAIIAALAAMVPMPIKFIYPSRTEPLRRFTVGLGCVWAVVTLAALARLPEHNLFLIYASLSYVLYYFAASFVLNLRPRLRRG